MQRAAFRTTLRALSESAKASNTKQTSFVKSVFTDTGNIPLVAANFAGCLLVVTFLGRKAFYHPDIGISAGNRFSNDIQNEGIGRLEDADSYREHHIVFAKVLEPLAAPLVSALVGNEVNTPKWKLNFAKTPVEDLVPLERTNFFDDGLYEQKKPSSLALNEENQNYDEYRL